MRGVAKIETFVPTTCGDQKRSGDDSLRFSRFEWRGGRTLRGYDRGYGVFQLHFHDGEQVAVAAHALQGVREIRGGFCRGC